MNNKQQTTLQQLKSTIKDGIGNMNGQLNDYKSGYKQCLIDIENLIDKQLLGMEKEQIMEAHYAPKYGCFSEDYYEQTYGGNK